MTKVCPQCKEEKDVSEFYKNSKRSTGHSAQCKECVKENVAEWKRLNREKDAKHSRNWYSKNKKCRIETIKQWQKNNRDKVNSYASKRRAAKLNATPAWADLEIIQDFYLEAQYHNMEVDHIIPLQHELVCGLHVEHNLQLLSMEQNRSKNNFFEVSL